MPSRKARHLSNADKEHSALEYLFLSIRPRLVFAHGNEPICFFKCVTGLSEVSLDPKPARWQTHEFLLSGRGGPLYTLSHQKASVLGRDLSTYL